MIVENKDIIEFVTKVQKILDDKKRNKTQSDILPGYKIHSAETDYKELSRLFKTFSFKSLEESFKKAGVSVGKKANDTFTEWVFFKKKNIALLMFVSNRK
jgi:hypothetical protein